MGDHAHITLQTKRLAEALALLSKAEKACDKKFAGASLSVLTLQKNGAHVIAGGPWVYTVETYLDYAKTASAIHQYSFKFSPATLLCAIDSSFADDNTVLCFDANSNALSLVSGSISIETHSPLCFADDFDYYLTDGTANETLVFDNISLRKALSTSGKSADYKGGECYKYTAFSGEETGGVAMYSTNEQYAIRCVVTPQAGTISRAYHLPHKLLNALLEYLEAHFDELEHGTTEITFASAKGRGSWAKIHIGNYIFSAYLADVWWYTPLRNLFANYDTPVSEDSFVISTDCAELTDAIAKIRKRKPEEIILDVSDGIVVLMAGHNDAAPIPLQGATYRGIPESITLDIDTLHRGLAGLPKAMCIFIAPRDKNNVHIFAKDNVTYDYLQARK